MNGYELTRAWFDFCFENPDKINPNHTAIFCFAIEHCNRMGWKEKFGFPTNMVMEVLGIKSYNTYIKYLNDLVEFGFIEMIEKSKNQYTANIIALSKNDKALNKALDKASAMHLTKQLQSTLQSNDSINKPINNKTNKPLNNKTSIFSFEEFWDAYPIKIGKKKCSQKYEKLSEDKREAIKNTIDKFIKHKPFESYRHPNPETYLNQERWNDELGPSDGKPKKSDPFQNMAF